MTKTPFISLALRASLVASAFLSSTGNASAINIDPFTFCTNTCKPGTCTDNDPKTGKGIKADCERICKKQDPSIWRHVAELQMSKDKKGFGEKLRKEYFDEKNKLFYEKDKGQKMKMQEKLDSMLAQTPIAQCLGIETSAKETAKVEQPQSAKPDSSASPSAPTASASPSHVTKAKNDLCAAAIQAEIKALDQNKTALQGQKENLEAQLKQLEAMN
ncbi:MAG: hypothetical protein K0R76_454 [Alphaproteobacteria bacterium]|jgi:hypothetical protein|nr:hypothetical protein [Alphaproteobacteria bacterium]